MRKYLFLISIWFLITGCEDANSILRDGSVSLDESKGIVVFRIAKADEISKFGYGINIVSSETGKEYYIPFIEETDPKVEGVYGPAQQQENFPVLKVVSMPAGKYFFASLDFGADLSGTRYGVKFSENAFDVKPGKMVYVGDIRVQSRVQENLFVGKSGTFWYRLDDNYDTVTNLMHTYYPTLMGQYRLEKKLASFKNTLFDWKQIDVSDVKIEEGSGTKEDPVKITIPMKVDSTKSLIENLEIIAQRKTAAIFFYLSKKYGEENKDWLFIKQEDSFYNAENLKVYHIEIRKNNSKEQKQIYFKIREIKP